MNTGNQNFVIGLVSAISLVAGLIYTILSIVKTSRDMPASGKKQKKGIKKDSPSHSRNDFRIFPVSIGFVIDAIFLLIFSLGSINAILEYLANEVPIFALVSALIFVMMYSYILIMDMPTHISQHIPRKEQRYFRLAGLIGMFISLGLMLLLGIQRLSLLFVSPSPYDSIIEKIFSLVVNLAVIPLLMFSLVSLHRIVRYVSNIVNDQQSA